jgi:hypothetical protein
MTVYTWLGCLFQERELLLQDESQGRYHQAHFMLTVPRLVPRPFNTPSNFKDIELLKTKGMGIITGGDWDKKARAPDDQPAG